jgi:hypothetical protein
MPFKSHSLQKLSFFSLLPHKRESFSLMYCSSLLPSFAMYCRRKACYSTYESKCCMYIQCYEKTQSIFLLTKFPQGGIFGDYNVRLRRPTVVTSKGRRSFSFWVRHSTTTTCSSYSTMPNASRWFATAFYVLS